MLDAGKRLKNALRKIFFLLDAAIPPDDDWHWVEGTWLVSSFVAGCFSCLLFIGMFFFFFFFFGRVGQVPGHWLVVWPVPINLIFIIRP